MLVAIAGEFMTNGLGSLSLLSRVFRMVWLGIGLVSASASLAAQFPADKPADACLRPYLKDSAKVGQYFFRSYEITANGDACLQVLRNGKVIFRRTVGNDGHYTLGQPANAKFGIPAISNGADLTGRGHPDMIVSYYTGGAHCCTLHYVFELEPQFRLLATLDAADGDFAHFSDPQQDHHYVYLANDWTFAYWRESFAGSPAPVVILRFVSDSNGGGYHLALDQMRRPEPKPAEWENATQEARDAFAENNPFNGGPGSDLWNNMLKLIYDGHSNLAWTLFDAAWPASKPGKGKFLSDFCSQLKTSPYWPDLAPKLKSEPPACANAKPENTGM